MTPHLPVTVSSEKKGDRRSATLPANKSLAYHSNTTALNPPPPPPPPKPPPHCFSHSPHPHFEIHVSRQRSALLEGQEANPNIVTPRHNTEGPGTVARHPEARSQRRAVTQHSLGGKGQALNQSFNPTALHSAHRGVALGICKSDTIKSAPVIGPAVSAKLGSRSQQGPGSSAARADNSCLDGGRAALSGWQHLSEPGTSCQHLARSPQTLKEMMALCCINMAFFLTADPSTELRRGKLVGEGLAILVISSTRRSIVAASGEGAVLWSLCGMVIRLWPLRSSQPMYLFPNGTDTGLRRSLLGPLKPETLEVDVCLRPAGRVVEALPPPPWPSAQLHYHHLYHANQQQRSLADQGADHPGLSSPHQSESWLDRCQPCRRSVEPEELAFR
ncbi:hypothetical protein EYF80_001550 [Xyrichtys novacula]|uniref:Uncharacterized protein n=1 Tax=Xyrichtys novacula TaxID=13765 RepID=A0AAV1H7P5_XYRNO|nr:hypothetical protein EYF80_001550 [Xyrichtys novacula]